jgi:hypothetical protein
MKASDFLKQLEQNPEYQELQRKQKEKQKQKIEQSKIIEEPFIKMLHSNGFTQINNASDLLQLKVLDKKLQNLLLIWIPKIDNKFNSQEILIRALAVSNSPFNGTLLTTLFDNKEVSPHLRWVIGNTIACAKVDNINEWIENKLSSSEQPMENQMLVYAAIKYFDIEKAKFFLRNLFKNHPLQVADAFTYVGNDDDAFFLATMSKNIEKKFRIPVDRAIKKIKKRVKKL